MKHACNLTIQKAEANHPAWITSGSPSQNTPEQKQAAKKIPSKFQLQYIKKMIKEKIQPDGQEKEKKESHVMYDKLTFKFFEAYSYSVTK